MHATRPVQCGTADIAKRSSAYCFNMHQSNDSGLPSVLSGIQPPKLHRVAVTITITYKTLVR